MKFSVVVASFLVSVGSALAIVGTRLLQTKESVEVLQIHADGTRTFTTVTTNGGWWYWSGVALLVTSIVLILSALVWGVAAYRRQHQKFA
jgi:hypothetical protein